MDLLEMQGEESVLFQALAKRANSLLIKSTVCNKITKTEKEWRKN
jgi:hypothetical protein